MTAEYSTDRAAGVLLGTACGDALGAGYEFGPPLGDDHDVAMIGGNRFAPGEWTDDTAMAICVAEVSAPGVDLRTAAGLDAVATGFLRWFHSGPKDVGIQTRAVLGASGQHRGDGLGAAMTHAASSYYRAKPERSAGNGALMRTAPLALSYLDEPDGLVEAAKMVGALTHGDPVSGEACALWSLAIRHAVRHGTFDGVRGALGYLPSERAGYWAAILDEAEARPPRDFDRNGWVVQALQGAWSAIVHTPVPADDPAAGSFAAQHFQLALAAAVRGGRDTDTVAAIAGGLLGARWGASAVPASWRRALFGWPGHRSTHLIRLGVHAARVATAAAPDDVDGWPGGSRVDYGKPMSHHGFTEHPYDPGVILSTVWALDELPPEVDAVVSLCRLGADQVPASGVAAGDHVEVWLIDAGSADNPHLEFVIDDAARAVVALRAEGKVVLLHCMAAFSRTPVVAARYGVLKAGVDPETALAAVVEALPETMVDAGLKAGLIRLGRPDLSEVDSRR
jgi:ADP-ribosyl-[dinitrogen reductase] hydrolase